MTDTKEKIEALLRDVPVVNKASEGVRKREWCFLWFHNWGKWSEGRQQRRHCKRCNRQQVKYEKGWMTS